MNTALSDAVIRLRTLGSVDLRAADGTQVQSVLRQPKRLALLIYLALNEPVFHRRDRLLALFWPESDEERARGSLSQAVFQLRAALGKDVIVSRGDDEVGLATNRLWCDAAVFDDLIRNNQFAEAMAMYSGELLPGFIIDDAPDFERWLDEQRMRRAQDAAKACIALSDAERQGGHLPPAIDWIRRAISIQPLSEPARQRLIALLDQSGDRAAALHAYEELRSLLRAEFDAEPSAETTELVHAVRARADAKSGSLASPVDTAAATEFTQRRWSPSLVVAAMAVVVIATAAVWNLLSEDDPEAARPPANRVAVLYFNDESANHDLAYLAEGLTSTLIDQLGQVKQLQVISRNGVRPFRGSSIPLDSVARQLNVGTLVGGSITSSNDILRVTVELIDGATGIVIQTRKLERPNGELFALLDEVSGEVASFLRMTVGREIRVREWQAETENVEAWRMLQEAEYLRAASEERENEGRIADALTALARADSLAARALSRDRRFVASLVMRGRIAERRGWLAFMTGQRDSSANRLAEGRDFANRAIALKSNSGPAFELRGVLGYWMWLLRVPHQLHADSLLKSVEADLRHSIQLDGERPRAESILSLVLYSQGNFAESRAAALRALEADAYLMDAGQITIRLFETSFELGDDQDAGHWCDAVHRRWAGHWPSAWCDLMLLGWGADGDHDPRKAMHALENFGPDDAPPLRQSMVPRLTMLAAGVVGRAGMRDSASAMLLRARSMAREDIELLYWEAAVRLLMKEDSSARQLLNEYLRANPEARPRVTRSRLFRDIADQIH